MNKEEFTKVLGLRISKIREKKKISKGELGRLTGKSYKIISRLEKGGTNPSLLFLGEIAEGLGVTIEELVKRLP